KASRGDGDEPGGLRAGAGRVSDPGAELGARRARPIAAGGTSPGHDQRGPVGVAGEASIGRRGASPSAGRPKGGLSGECRDADTSGRGDGCAYATTGPRNG